MKYRLERNEGRRVSKMEVSTQMERRDREDYVSMIIIAAAVIIKERKRKR